MSKLDKRLKPKKLVEANADGVVLVKGKCIGCGSDGTNIPVGCDPEKNPYYWHVFDTVKMTGVCGPCAMVTYKCITTIHNLMAQPLVSVMQPNPKVAVVRKL